MKKLVLWLVLVLLPFGAVAQVTTINVKSFGAKGNCTTPVDDTAAIQKALDAASTTVALAAKTQVRQVFFPAGCYLITSTLDATNNRSTGLVRDGLTLVGEGRSTVLIGKTGAGKAIIETTGSQFFRMDGFQLNTTSTYISSGQSTIGIQQALGSVLAQTQNQHYKDVSIQMHDDAAANAGVGTVAIWNFGSEENTYDTMYLQANVAIVLTSVNDGVNQPGPLTLTSYQSLASSHSLGVTTFIGENFMLGLNRRNAPVILQNVTNVQFDNTYIGNSGSGGTNKAAIWWLGNATNMKFHGTIETLENLRFDGAMYNSNLEITWGGVTTAAQPIIRVKRTATNLIFNSTISLDMETDRTHSSGNQGAVLTTDDDDEATASNYGIYKTTIKMFKASGGTYPDTQCYVPSNVAQNAGTVGLDITGCASVFANAVCMYVIDGDTNNNTGDGTVVLSNTMGWDKIIDTGNLCNTSGGFTAKLTGRYMFTAAVELSGITSDHNDAQLYLQTASVNFQLDRKNPYVLLYGGLTQAHLAGTIIMDIPATATASPAWMATKSAGGGAKVVDTLNGKSAAGYRSYFSVKKLD